MAGVFSLLPRGLRGGVFSSNLGMSAGISGTVFFRAALSAARRTLPAASFAWEFLRILFLTIFLGASNVSSIILFLGFTSGASSSASSRFFALIRCLLFAMDRCPVRMVTPFDLASVEIGASSSSGVGFRFRFRLWFG